MLYPCYTRTVLTAPFPGKLWLVSLILVLHLCLADGDVHCAASVTYQIVFRLPIPNPNPIPSPNPEPKINKKQNGTRMKLNTELYLKVDFLVTGWVYKRPITGTGKETHMDIHVFY